MDPSSRARWCTARTRPTRITAEDSADAMVTSFFKEQIRIHSNAMLAVGDVTLSFSESTSTPAQAAATCALPASSLF